MQVAEGTTVIQPAFPHATDPRADVATAVQEWCARNENTKIAQEGETLVGFVSEKMANAKKQAETTRKARLAAIAQHRARQEALEAAQKAKLEAIMQVYETIQRGWKDMKNKAITYNLEMVAQRRRAEKTKKEVDQKVAQMMIPNAGVGLTAFDCAWHKETIFDADLSLDAQETECGFTYPAKFFWLSAVNNPQPLRFMAAFEAARAKCTDAHVAVSIHCEYEQIAYFMKEFEGLFWDPPYLIGSTFESLTLETESPYEDMKNLHDSHREGTLSGFIHSVILTGSTSANHLRTMQVQMTKRFVGIGASEMSRVRDRWPGHVEGHVQPGQYEPYSFKANLTGGIHGPTFPVASAIANYFVWRTDPLKTKQERARKDQVWVLSETNTLDIVTAILEAALCPVVFRPFHLPMVDKQQVDAFEKTLSHILKVCSFFFTSQVRKYMTKGMDPFTSFSLLCLICAACAGNEYLEPLCFLYSHETDPDRRLVYDKDRHACEAAATGLYVGAVPAFPNSKSNTTERGLFFNQMAKAVADDKLPELPALPKPPPHCFCVPYRDPLAHLHIKPDCHLPHVFTKDERANAVSDAMRVPSAEDPKKFSTVCYFCVTQLDKTGRVFEDPTFKDKHFDEEFKGMCRLRYSFMVCYWL